MKRKRSLFLTMNDSERMDCVESANEYEWNVIKAHDVELVDER
jgi:hypothetical protein